MNTIVLKIISMKIMGKNI